MESGSSNSDSSENDSSESDLETPVKRTPDVQKKIRPSGDFFDLFKCYYCSDYFELPVRQCRRNHFLCHTCIIEKSKTCPSCRAQIMEETEWPSYYRLMSEMEYDCKWQANGCDAKLLLSQYRSHIRTCEFSDAKTECYFMIFRTYSDCEWIGRCTEIVQHLVNKHHNRIYEMDLITEPIKVSYYFPEIKFSSSSQKIFKLDLGSENFIHLILEYYYESEQNEVSFMIRSDKPTKFFKYEISLLNIDGEPVFTQSQLLTCNFSDKFSLDIAVPMSICAKIPLSKLNENKFINKEDEKDMFSVQINLNNL